jgi:hypothetical protein
LLFLDEAAQMPEVVYLANEAIQKLRSERAALVARREAIRSVKSKLDDNVRDLAAAHKDLELFDTAHGDEIAKWVSAGAADARPVADHKARNKIIDRITALEHVVQSNAPALQRLSDTDADFTKQINAFDPKLHDEAAKQLAAVYEAMASEARGLRQTLADIEAKLNAARHHFVTAGHAYKELRGKRNPHLDNAMRAAVRGLPEYNAQPEHWYDDAGNLHKSDPHIDTRPDTHTATYALPDKRLVADVAKTFSSLAAPK